MPASLFIVATVWTLGALQQFNANYILYGQNIKQYKLYKVSINQLNLKRDTKAFSSLSADV